MSRTVFGTYHPIINFIFYLGAFVFAIFLRHPMYLMCSVFCAAVYYLLIKGERRWSWFVGLVIVFVVLSLVNPLFNQMGDTVLFVYGGRKYTMEALYYGMALAALLVTVLGWFSSYNMIMTSDKFTYLFGKWFPSFSMLFTMVLRFVPRYRKKALQIRAARQGIQKAGKEGSWKQKADDGLQVISALTSWALEGGIATADSMKNRGYGSGRRTRFSIYRWEYRDWLLLLWLLVTAGINGICIIAGGADVSYIPSFTMQVNSYTICGMISYSLFLITPSILQIWEDITWHILKSKI